MSRGRVRKEGKRTRRTCQMHYQRLGLSVHLGKRSRKVLRCRSKVVWPVVLGYRVAELVKLQLLAEEVGLYKRKL